MKKQIATTATTNTIQSSNREEKRTTGELLCKRKES